MEFLSSYYEEKGDGSIFCMEKKGTVLFSVRCRDRFPNGPFGERTLHK